MPRIYDSGDPNFPNLPHDWNFDSESDQEFSDRESISSKSTKKSQRYNYLFDRSTSNIPPVAVPVPDTSSKRRNRKYSESAYSSTAAKKRISWEPGIDINTTDVVIGSIGSAITVVDYSEGRYRVERTNVYSNILNTIEVETDSDFYLHKNDSMEYDIKSKQSVADFKKILQVKRPDWAQVRWINVNGLSWEAIAAIGEHYDLHRLAIEDMIDIPQRTKTDIYSGHLFGVLPLIKLVRTKKHEPKDFDSWWNRILKKMDLYNYMDEEQEKDDDEKFNDQHIKEQTLGEKISESHEMRRLNETFYPANYSKRRLRILDDHRPLSYRDLFVGVEQCSFFMLKEENTVISFFESSGDDIEQAILGRISTDETILRTSGDPSVLLQSIIDAIVDIIYPVITAYRKRLSEFEVDILTNPDIKHTQSLHLMSGELSKLRRSLLPTTALINSLKDHSTAALYLADVSDHTQMFTDEIEGMITSIENLVGLIFNTISTESNNAMQQLSLVTVIFLPLSFWTGYYGMNFQSFGDLKENVSYYWKIAMPFSVGLLILITWSFIKKSIVDFKRQMKRRVQEIKFNRDYKKRQKLKEKRKRAITNSFNEHHHHHDPSKIV
ncbi:unnamed protein product [Wickerhamomyces anomalus]